MSDIDDGDGLTPGDVLSRTFEAPELSTVPSDKSKIILVQERPRRLPMKLLVPLLVVIVTISFVTGRATRQDWQQLGAQARNGSEPSRLTKGTRITNGQQFATTKRMKPSSPDETTIPDAEKPIATALREKANQDGLAPIGGSESVVVNGHPTTGNESGNPAVGKSPISPAAEDTEILLFNGKNLEGWTARADRQHLLRNSDLFIDRGELHSPRAFGSNISTIAGYQNFILKLEYRIPVEAVDVDSAIQLSCLPTENSLLQVEGLEINTEPTGRNIAFIVRPREAGNLRIGIPGNLSSFPPSRDRLQDAENPIGQWNDIEILASGATLTFFLNGKKVNQARTNDSKIFHVSINGWSGSDVRYRNIRLRPLPKANVKSPRTDDGFMNQTIPPAIEADKSHVRSSQSPLHTEPEITKGIPTPGTDESNSSHLANGRELATTKKIEPSSPDENALKGVEIPKANAPREKADPDGLAAILEDIRRAAKTESERIAGLEEIKDRETKRMDATAAERGRIDGLPHQNRGMGIPFPPNFPVQIDRMCDEQRERFRQEMMAAVRNQRRGPDEDGEKLDHLRSGTVWKGERSYRQGGYAGKTVTYELYIRERDDHTFKGHKFDNGPRRNRAEVEGWIVGEEIAWMEGGDTALLIAHGTLVDDIISLKFNAVFNNGATTAGDGKLVHEAGRGPIVILGKTLQEAAPEIAKDIAIMRNPAEPPTPVHLRGRPSLITNVTNVISDRDCHAAFIAAFEAVETTAAELCQGRFFVDGDRGTVLIPQLESVIEKLDDMLRATPNIAVPINDLKDRFEQILRKVRTISKSQIEAKKDS